MLIALIYQATGESYPSMVYKFGGWYNKYSYPIHFFINHIYRKQYHLISGNSLRLWTGHIDVFRKAIWKKTAFDNEGVKDLPIDLENFRVFSFLDTMGHETCVPGSGPVNSISNQRRPNAYWLQRGFYSRYGKNHGLKSQVLLLPNGMSGHVQVHTIAHITNSS